MVVVPLDAAVLPLDFSLVGDAYASVAELRWSAIGAADELSGPSAFYLVEKLFLGKFLRLVSEALAGGCKEEEKD